MVVCPASRSSVRMLLLHIRNDGFAQLGSKAQMMNLMRESVRLVFEVVLEIVYVDVAVGEGFSGRKVEVSNDLVHADAALKTAPFLALGVEVFRIVLALALFHTFAATEGPRNRGVGFAHFVAGVTAAWLQPVGRRGSTEAFAAVVGSEVRGFVFVAVCGVSRARK